MSLTAEGHPLDTIGTSPYNGRKPALQIDTVA